jgi:nitrite reductase/ring-hydroxylating ferredoxin subunit/DMSO/TMAO reductase YedYZ heme-binding membrane subunit
MSNTYSPVLWNRQKKVYDRVMLSLMALYLILFITLQIVFYPEITVETLIIRATGTLAYLMLHVILCIGPLSRLNPLFLPLLYNRRHLGVTMFLICFIHGMFNIVQFHALGNADPLVSLFTANTHYNSFVNFPFQVFGFFAMIILFLMAATSHDFWLRNLSPKVWKTLHMLVYFAYALLILHVMLGVVQLENSWGWLAPTGIGMITVVGLHVTSAFVEKRKENLPSETDLSGFYEVCKISEIEESRAKMVLIKGENIAIFKYDGKLSAVNNFCRHQGGPLGEGKIIDGCITCPWHGYQYLAHNGQSPPPFDEKVETYDVKIVDEKIYVNPKPYAVGTERPPAIIDQ